MGISKKTILLLILLGVIILIVSIGSIRNFVFSFLNENVPFFSYLNYHISSGTPVGIAISIAYANIPILPSIPSEAYAIIAYTKGTSVILIISIITGIYLLFALIYYLIGFFFGLKIIEKITKRKVKYNKTIQKYSDVIIFLLYLIPIPYIGSFVPILLLFFGAYKIKFKRIIVAVGFATALRFLIVLIFYELFRGAIRKIFFI